MFEFSRSRAPRTTELYEQVWKDWERFCISISAQPIPATTETVLEFLQARERSHSTSALSARKNAILAAHKDARSRLPDTERQPYMLEHDDKLKMGWKEITRRKGNRHTPREAVGADKLRLILAQIPATPTGVMDRAALLAGLVYAMRRSEIAALNRDDIEVQEDTMFVHIRRSKTDQIGNGVTLAAVRASSAESCPVAAMERWLAARGNSDGALFLHPKFKSPRRISNEYVYSLMKRYGKLAFGDSRLLGAHSLRRGCITEIHEAGVDAKSGMSHSRHVTPGIYYGYVAGKEAEKNPAVHALARAL
jgi:integrase